MIRPILAAGSLGAALALSPAVAQQQSPAPAPPQAQPAPQVEGVDAGMVGLAVYSSDGEKVGEVTEVGMAGGTPAVRVEMGQFLGVGSSSVIVNAKAIGRKADRVEIAMTAAEIKQTIAQQRQKPPQPPAPQ